MPHFHDPCLGGAGGQSTAAYEIEQSLRFRGNSTYFTKTFGSSGNRRKFTLSVWVKKATVTAVSPNNTGLNFFGSNSGSVGDSMNVGMNADTTAVQFYQYNSGYAGGIFSDARYRDPSAWMHMVFVWDSAQATQSDRMAVYVNNRIERPDGSAGSPDTGPSLNKDAAWNYSSYTHTIGGTYQTNDMYLAEAHHIDGQALDPSSFGEYDSNGVWRPIEYTGTYTGNSFYLKFDPSATNGIGHDHSGLGNNWTPTGFTTSGTGTDVMSDTPTNNFCTWNPLDKQSTLSKGNLNATMPGRAAGTFAVTSGKWYWECKYNAGNGYALGIGIADIDAYYPSEAFSFGVIYYGQDGSKYVLGTNSSYSTAYSGGHFGIALDLDSSQNTIEFFINGTSKGTINIPDGRNWTPIVQGGSGSTSGSWDLYTDPNTWTYTAPTGFNALNTSNLPAPDIADGSDYFQTDLDTGANILSSAQGIFSNGLWWIKDRDNSNQHQFVDSVRGGSLTLTSPNVQAETSYSTPSGSSVAWAWNTGTGTTTNPDGSIQSTVSANASAGFSIVSADTASSVTTATYGHGLNVAPSFMMVRPREGGAYHFFTYHKDIGAGKYIFLNNSTTPTTSSTIWNNTAPSSTVFTLGTLLPTDQGTSQGFIAYCFAEVEGYSKFSSYTGNGNGDGPFVYCGFRPRWIMTRAYTRGTEWVIWDTARNPYNLAELSLQAQATSNEASVSYYDIDILSNGFKIRTSYSTHNQSGQSYLVVAFAENPFGGFGVSPATAR